MARISADKPKQIVALPAGDRETTAERQPSYSIARTQPNDRVGDVAHCSRRRSGQTAVYPRACRHVGRGESARAARQQKRAAKSAALPYRNMGLSSRHAIASKKQARAGSVEFINPLDRRVVMQISVELERMVALA